MDEKDLNKAVFERFYTIKHGEQEFLKYQEFLIFQKMLL